jgi:hypothetical protein
VIYSLMKVAMMSVAPLDTGSSAVTSAAVESVVDAYATRVLQKMSPTEAVVDTSVGPYITSLLRCAEIHDQQEVTALSEFDSLLELLEDQCSMEQEAATSAVKAIAKAVVTGIVPSEIKRDRSSSFGLFGGNTIETRTRSASFGLYTGGGLDSFKTLRESIEPLEPIPATPACKGKMDPISSGGSAGDPFNPLQTGGPSPMKMENLVPVDLLGALDNPSPHISRIGGHAHYRQAYEQEQQPKEEVQLSNDDEAFPTLKAAVSAPVKRSAGEKTGRGKKGLKTHSDRDLAAALFRPARPRQNSIEIEDIQDPYSKHLTTTAPSNSYTNQYYQQQLDSCVEILLSMNHELSEEAATAAGLMANSDFNIAQYIVDAAMSAKPVCRHMLHDGCYRSDCQFSHDVEGHTCLFWLRGRCGKGGSCKFLHGFNEKHMEGISTNDTEFDPVSFVSPTKNNYSSSFPSPGSNNFVSPSMSVSRGGPSFQRKVASSTSFANIASQGYNEAKFSSPSAEGHPLTTSLMTTIPTVRIPQDLWNPHENRDATLFHIPDPIERFNKVSATVKRRDVVDLHFQSTKTFSTVLYTILPQKLTELDEVWIVTGTGHHIGSKTHQKGGGALERAATNWLMEQGYNCAKGRDRNGQGGAILVKR